MDCHEGHKLDYNPKVTVIVHNGSSKTIESVENQIYTNIQLLNIFEETKAKSFNKGLTLADGEYVSFWIVKIFSKKCSLWNGKMFK